MKMKFVSVLLGSVMGIALIGSLATAGPQGKIMPWGAMETAVKKVGGGKAIQATYTKEDGKLIYDVIVVKDKKLTEVAVDAMTGKAGAVEQVTPEEEGKEFVNDLKVALGNKTAALAKD